MPTREQLAQRRRLVAAASKRRPRRAVPDANLPRPTAYTRALVALARELNDALTAEVLAALTPPRVDAGADGGDPPLSTPGLVARLKRLAAQVVKRQWGALDRAVFAAAEGVTEFSRVEWARQAKAAVGIDLAAIEPNLTPTIERFRRSNLDLITSLSKEKVSRVQTILEEHAGSRVETIRDRIMEEEGVTKRQAALIARDQVLSLNAEVAQARHQAAGVEEYYWRTSGDGDVRPAHRALNGKRFRYDDPPVVDAKRGRREHPGGDYQCRCTAEPVIPGFDDEPS